MTPVVFVHGFMGGSAQWHLQQDAFAGREVIALDLPGFGARADRAAFDSIAGFARWALDWLSTQGVMQFDLVGHSMGGMIVQEMAALAPDRIRRLVLYGTGPLGALPGRFETISTSKQRATADGPQATARRIAATWFLAREKAAAFEATALLAERSSIQAILAGLDAMQGWDGRPQLAHITPPTLVICGDADRTYAWAQTHHLWQQIPNARLAVIPGCAHAAHLEKPALFNHCVADFLAVNTVWHALHA